MSVLLGHSAALHALSRAFLAQGEKAGEGGDDQLDRFLTNVGRALEVAAADLDEQIKAGCTGETRPIAAPRKGKAP